jgi:hypothetical protein
MKLIIKTVKVLIIIIILFSLTLSVINGQGINSSLRSMDNNHLQATDTSDWNIFRKIKEIRLSKKNPLASVSFGGDIREQLRYFNNLNFGDAIPVNDFYLQQRYMIHADLSINKYFRLFTQLNATQVNWKNSVSSSDRDKPDIMQAFLDIRIYALPSRFRFGRQELLFGSERIMGPRDGPNNRQTFDGLRYTLNFKRLTGEILLVRPVLYKPEIFDNTWRRDQLILAGYWTLSLKNKSLLDIYYFGDYQQNISDEGVNFKENRHSLGVRLSKSAGSYYYDIEGTFQRGVSNVQYIHGWHFTSITGYCWKDLPMSPDIQLKGSVFSGDKDSTDNQINSFIPISAKPTVNNLLPIGPTNVILIAPKGQIEIAKGIDLSLTYFMIWRLRKTDGLYSRDMERIIRPPDKPGENNGLYVAGGPTAEIYYSYSKHFNISLQAGYFFAGKYVRNTGNGKDVRAVALKAYYSF